MKAITAALVLGGVSLPIGAALACWADVPVEELVKDSPTVVVGKVERIKHAKPSNYAYDVAYIKVARVLKHTGGLPVAAGKEVPLSMPSIHNRSQMSTDIRYSKGASGVWILESREKSPTFWATYPKDLQPHKEEPNIRAIILKQSSPSDGD
jgi:hypothetical protein